MPTAENPSYFKRIASELAASGVLINVQTDGQYAVKLTDSDRVFTTDNLEEARRAGKAMVAVEKIDRDERWSEIVRLFSSIPGAIIGGIIYFLLGHVYGILGAMYFGIVGGVIGGAAGYFVSKKLRRT